MRVHRVLAEASAELLKSVFRDRKVLDHEVTKTFKDNPKWGKRDRAFVAETVYEVVRWRRALAHVADSPEVSALCAAQWVRAGFEIPEWWKFNGTASDKMKLREETLSEESRAVKESIPDWLDEWGVKELGEDAWTRELAALNQRAPVYLRVNTLKNSPEEAIAWLKYHDVEVERVEGVELGLKLPEGRMLPKPLRAEGKVEIQDAGSQCIAPLLDAQPGERIIDACSGAGGKALQLAATMNNEGKLYAMDVEQSKLSELKKRARQAGASCIAIKPITETTATDFEGVADRLLIDSPCSGLGTLRRQPDLKWRLRAASIERAQAIQRELLVEYSRMLKPGGRLVYATCSILPSENREAVDVLLAEGGFRLLEERSITPAVDGFDGFYAAALEKSQ